MESGPGIREQLGEDEDDRDTTWPLEVPIDPPWWANRWVSLVLGMLTGFLAGGLVSYFGFHPSPKNPAPAWSIVGPLAVSLALWQLWPRPARARRLEIDPAGLTVTKTDGTIERTAAGDVLLIAARRGLTHGAGEVLPVRGVRVVTGEREWTMKLQAVYAPAVFQALAEVCTTAILLGPEGPPFLPPALVEMDPAGAVASSRVLVRRELGRQARRTAVLAGAIFVCVGTLTALLMWATSTGGAKARGGSIGKALFYIVVGAVVALVAAAQAARTWLRARRVDRALREYVAELEGGRGAGGEGRMVA